MNLADELAAIKGQPASGPRCGVYHLLAQLGDDAEALEAALADQSWQHAQIGRVLRNRGFDIQDVTIGRHRKGDCRCPRSTDA